MPHISLKVYEGKSEETLKEMAVRLHDALMGEPWNMKDSDVSVSVVDYAPDAFECKVKENICANEEKLVISSEWINFEKE